MNKMAPDQWRQVFELLDTVLDLPSEQRAAWVDALDESCSALQPALRELLARRASLETSDFLRSAWHVVIDRTIRRDWEKGAVAARTNAPVPRSAKHQRRPRRIKMTASNAPGSDDQRIRALIDAASKARAEGRADEAARFARQAEQEFPQHPLVLNEIGQRLLVSGDLVRAHDLLAQAVKADSSNPSLWINLAAALRGLNRHDEELQALDQALAIEPANLRALLQRASIQELQNNPRGAAYTKPTIARSSHFSKSA